MHTSNHRPKSQFVYKFRTIQMNKLKLATSQQMEEEPRKRRVKNQLASVWNPDFKYKPGGTAMDLARKFEKIRREMQKETAEEETKAVLGRVK